MINSPRTQEAIKLALALTLTYWIVLSLDWEKSSWAALGLVTCSMATSGESLNRGMMRVFGTIMAAIVSLIMIGLFGQAPWLMILWLSIWLGMCRYISEW
jgi:uncharacterized membrane protein YccC